MAKYKLPAEVLLKIGGACGHLHQAKDQIEDIISAATAARRIGVIASSPNTVMGKVEAAIKLLHQIVEDCEEAT
jgi:hypothetical protein